MKVLSVRLAGAPEGKFQDIPDVDKFDIHPSGTLIVRAADGEEIFFSPYHWVGANLREVR